MRGHMSSKTLHKISYGMYIISSKIDNRFNGQIANTLFQITSDPPTIAVSINKQNLTHEFIQKSKIFAVSILSKETPMKFIGNFGFKSGRDTEKFKDIKYKTGVTGAPIVLENAIGYLEADVINSLDSGTHTIFIGKVADAEILNDREPMTYAYYHEIKRGTSPSTAPTYIGAEKQEKSYKTEKNVIEKMDKYKCTICNYIYDPEKGDPDSGVKPGTPFEKLPDDWSCPVCGADKSEFEKVD
jgi:flavin reductase (DIM6/NTAB) family NADH-FMN oxidoreductase RutF/rubredoxin